MLWGAEERAGPHWRDRKRFLKEVVWWAKFKEWPQWSSPFYNFILFEYVQNLWICWDIIPVIMFLYLAKRSLSKWAQSHHMNLLEEENLIMRATWDSREVFCSWDGGGHVERAESNLYEVRVTPANSQQEKIIFFLQHKKQNSVNNLDELETDSTWEPAGKCLLQLTPWFPSCETLSRESSWACSEFWPTKPGGNTWLLV